MVRGRKSLKHGITYEYRFEIAPVDGKRKWSSKGGFLSEREARIAGVQALKNYRLCGIPKRTENMSYADFLDEWMENECKYNLKETTLLNYRKKINNHIKPELGAYQIGRITREKLQRFLQKKHDAGYSRNTLSTLRGIISKSMTYAMESGVIQVSPAGNLKIPRSEMTSIPTRSEPHSYLSKEKMERIFKRFPEGSPSHIPLMIGYRCGLRIGEVYALTWDDVDLKKRKLTVSRQVQWKQNPRSKEEKIRENGSKCKDAGFWYFSTPKCNSYRTIDMDEQLTSLLLRERDKQRKAMVYYADRYQHYYVDSNQKIVETTTDTEVKFICRRESGEYINLRTMQYTTYIIHNEMRIPEFDFHSLRHTHATMLVENAAPLKYVQQRLGHKKIEVTMNIYQHLTETIQGQGKAIIGKMFE